jgi:DNA (cytosine-5)-methyltransferase 1
MLQIPTMIAGLPCVFPRRPRGIDLFAGAGGLSLGFEQAGFDVVAAVEVDPIHAAVHRYNFPHCPVVARSVADLSGTELRAIAAAGPLGDGPIDVVFGGAPCQGFSLIGQRALDDPRNGLVREFVRLVTELEASYFVFENVKGLTIGKHRQFLAELIAAFEQRGYAVTQPWQVLNAAWFGTPQNRERLLLLGARRGLPLPVYPKPTHRPPKWPQRWPAAWRSLPPSPTCAEALADLPDVDRFGELGDRDTVAVRRWAKLSPYGHLMRPDPALPRTLTPDPTAPNGWFAGYRRPWNPRQLTNSIRTAHTEISRRRFAETAPGQVEPVSRFFKLPPDGLANTLRAGTDSARGAFTSPRPIHYQYPRCITVREMARLHGFPDWFRLHSTKWHGARQIGNAVPPPLARAIAHTILAALGQDPTYPEEMLTLGDESLLHFDMSQASAFWDIERPIRGRDRKSGVRKRSQEEVERDRLQKNQENQKKT